MSQSNVTTRRALLKGAPGALAILGGGALLQRPAEAAGYEEPSLLTAEQREQVGAAHSLVFSHLQKCLAAGDPHLDDVAFIERYCEALKPLEGIMRGLAAELADAMGKGPAGAAANPMVDLFARQMLAGPMADAFAAAWKLQRSAPEAPYADR